jgi:hypothetical protein
VGRRVNETKPLPFAAEQYPFWRLRRLHHLPKRLFKHTGGGPGEAKCGASAEDGGNAPHSADWNQIAAIGIVWMTEVAPLAPVKAAFIKAPPASHGGVLFCGHTQSLRQFRKVLAAVHVCVLTAASLAVL